MNDFRTMPNPALQDPKKQAAKINLPSQVAATQKGTAFAPTARVPQVPNRRPSKPKGKIPTWLLLVPLGLFAALMAFVGAGILVVYLSYSNSILPRVQLGTIELGGLSQAEAAQVLNRDWGNLRISDGNQSYQVSASSMGISLDASQTAANAFAQGHGEGSLTGFFQVVYINPVISLDATIMQAELERIEANFRVLPVDAGVTFLNGQVQATAPEMGRMLDIGATIRNLQTNPAILADGILELSIVDVAPLVMDSSPLLAQAQSLLASPLDIRVFDPVTGDSVYWSVAPQTWATWLTASPNPNSPIGLSLSADAGQVQAYLSQQENAQFDESRYLDLSEATQSVQAALTAGRPQDAYVTVKHHQQSHVVQAGETITSIAWDYGIPYLYIMEANGGIQDVSVGQSIVIPPADIFLSGAVNPDKRIVVSISEQRTRVYENGQLIHDWVASTGIASSPTWTGVYQILSHEPNAYAANWNLYMPDFMGVYQPVPNADFTNGFHGFPTRGGGQLLWENSLGTRVTYGCILLSNTNIEILYNWAEEGVIVEILP